MYVELQELQQAPLFKSWVQALGDKASNDEILDDAFAAIKVFTSSKTSDVCMQLREKLFKYLENSLQTQVQRQFFFP